MELKFTNERKPRELDRVDQRRQKLIANIDSQLAKLENPDTTSRGAWFWQAKNGKHLLSIKYGRTDIELSKGMFSIECADIAGVKDALETVRVMAVNGKLDDALQKASDALRAKFKKK